MAQAVVPSRLIALLSSWGAAAGTAADAAADLVARYAEPHRHYHRLEHIDSMLALAERLAANIEVTCAVWFHDAVYEPSRSDNEHRSATYAREVLTSLGAPRDCVDEVARLVMTTVHHRPDGGDANGKLLADADLAILGAPPDRYQQYVHDVRAEYAHVSDDDWRRGRAVVLNAFLERPRLFDAWQLFDACEAQARANLRTELAALTPS